MDGLISLLIPTRGRPANIRRLVSSVHATAERPELVEMLFYVDADDPPSFDTLAGLATAALPVQLRLMMGRRDGISRLHNHLAAGANGTVLFLGADDLVFQTAGWDTAVRAAFDLVPDGILFAFADDGHYGAAFGSHAFVGRPWVETLGYLSPPQFRAEYADTWLNDLAAAVDRRVYLEGVLIEHMHPDWGKAAWDATYQASRMWRATSEILYRDLEGVRVEDAAKLRAAIAAAEGKETVATEA